MAALTLAACHRRQAGTRAGEFPPCAGQRYLTVTNGTSRSYDVFLRTAANARIYMATVYAESRVDTPIDDSITSGIPELVEVRTAGRRISTGPELARQYAVIVCR